MSRGAPICTALWRGGLFSLLLAARLAAGEATALRLAQRVGLNGSRRRTNIPFPWSNCSDLPEVLSTITTEDT
ncbi:MAG: hypothetical protein ACOCYP_10835, partial [Planctomycetota bacterium]